MARGHRRRVSEWNEIASELVGFSLKDRDGDLHFCALQNYFRVSTTVRRLDHAQALERVRACPAAFVCALSWFVTSSQQVLSVGVVHLSDTDAQSLTVAQKRTLAVCINSSARTGATQKSLLPSHLDSPIPLAPCNCGRPSFRHTAGGRLSLRHTAKPHTPWRPWL